MYLLWPRVPGGTSRKYLEIVAVYMGFSPGYVSSVTRLWLSSRKWKWRETFKQRF